MRLILCRQAPRPQGAELDTRCLRQYIASMAQDVIVRCPHCGARNRIPVHRWGDDRAVCGRCKSHLALSSLFPDKPVSISDATFSKEVLGFPGAVLLEFFSPW